jgi:hypothetical protein
MPLNALQQEALFSTITMHLDTIGTSKVGNLKKREWLQLITSNTKPTIGEAVQILKQYPVLTKGLTNVDVPNEVRNTWRQLITLIDDSTLIPDYLLKQLSNFNNYNPLLMAEMRLFENKIDAVPELSAIKDALLCLREVYLEMTPLVSSSHGGHSRTFCFRLGQVPFNLDKLGPPPFKGEIQKEVEKLIEERLTQADKDRKEMDEKDKSEETAVLAFTTVEKILGTQALHALLGEMTEQQKNDLFKQQKSSAKHDRLEEMQHRFLSNRLTDMMRQATTNMSKIDMELRASKVFIELRVSECCKVLLGVQETMAEECFKTLSFNADEFNKRYQEQLQTTYQMYLDDMINKWTLDRKRWLSDGVDFSATVGKFKKDFEDAMTLELRGFRSFMVNSLAELNKLKAKMPKKMEKQANKAQECKQKWDAVAMPLMELADKCNELRRLRSQIQQSECSMEAFNNIVTVLSKIRHGLSVSGTDENRFNLLHYACWGGNLSLIKDLLAQGVPADLNDSEGNCIIHLAVENESPATPEILETLMKQKLFTNVNSVLELKNRFNKTPLHVAAAFGNVTFVQWILGISQKGKALDLLNLESEANGRMTPLHYAAREGEKGVVDCLLAWGAGRSMRLLDNNHPLVMAIERGRLGVVHSFFKQGIWLNLSQKEHLLKMAQKKSKDVFLKNTIAYCLTIIPVLEGLNTLARLKSVLVPANSCSIVVPATSTTSVAGEDNISSTSNQSIVMPLNLSVSVAKVEEELPQQAAQGGMLFSYESGTRGRAVAADVISPADAAPPLDVNATSSVETLTANRRTTVTATL